jgi:anti-sigma28 factor (negative regulator of flagellin synthesis)
LKIDDRAPLAGAALNRPAEANLKSAERARSNSDQQPADVAGVSDLTARLLSSGEQRVEELKRLYQAGKYDVPASDIAAKLIGEHEEH